MSTSLTRRLIASTLATLLVILFLHTQSAHAKKTRAPAGGRVAVVVDERLSALRDAPDLAANLLQRMRRGRSLSVKGTKVSADGVTFLRVGLSRRTSGWVQSDAVVIPTRVGEDERLLRLTRGSEGFDLIERAALFLELFPRSPLRPSVLLLAGEAAEAAAPQLSREAARRLDEREMTAGGAPAHTYFLNYNGLDRFNRAGIRFVFDRATKQFHYDGAAWREILRRHPNSTEAAEARKRLGARPAATR